MRVCVTAMVLSGRQGWQSMKIATSPTMSYNGATEATVRLSATSIDFGAFDQSAVNVGGDILVSAGGNSSDSGASLP